MRSKLVDQVLSGKSAQYVVDALLEDLPPLPVIRSSIVRDLPKDTIVRIDDNVFFLQAKDPGDKPKIYEQVRYFELAYPELEFVVEDKCSGE